MSSELMRIAQDGINAAKQLSHVGEWERHNYHNGGSAVVGKGFFVASGVMYNWYADYIVLACNFFPALAEAYIEACKKLQYYGDTGASDRTEALSMAIQQMCADAKENDELQKTINDLTEEIDARDARYDELYEKYRVLEELYAEKI
jgi:hypothetical protein